MRMKPQKTLLVVLFSSIFLASCLHGIRSSHIEYAQPVPIDMCIAFAEEQLKQSVESVQSGGQFPRFIREDGRWETTDSFSWSSGLFAGCLWLMYEYTGDETWKMHAEKWTNSMEAGLLELKSLAGNMKARTRYTRAALSILQSLTSTRYLAKGSDSMGILKHATWKKPTDPQADTSLIWRDYSFLEALMRLHKEK